ncbi:MAG: hypothetical protein M9899_03485 [Bdellovibrionaceae bacterium]|nr:hypothetical protein [Pseudobdellovibrionaceae bacterium]
MKALLRSLIYVLPALLITLTALAQSEEWTRKMLGFVGPVAKIYSVDLNKSTFTEQERATLSSAIQDLNNVSHGLKFSVINFFSKKDPAIKAEYDQFKHSLDMAEKLMPLDPKQSVFYTRHAIGQCAACHSKGGKSTHLFDLFKDNKIPETEKGHLALAMRDYQASAEIFKTILLTSATPSDYFQTHRALVHYINSALLADYDKDKILVDLKNIQDKATNKGTLNDLKNLRSNVSKPQEIKSVQEALTELQSYQSDFMTFEKSLYTSLKIKNLLHEKLKDLKTNEERASAYAALGDIYAHFPEISIFMVPENYYALCVRTHPKTELASECFKKYEDKIILGYSGSSGMHVPEFERARIKELKKFTK